MSGPSATPVDELLRSLLFEGYALYPYTPGAIKNATPTPFGIVYPPVYAAGSGATFDHLQIECELLGGAADGVEAAVLFLQPTGERHQAAERRVALAAPGEQAFAHDGVEGRVVLEVARATRRGSACGWRTPRRCPRGSTGRRRCSARWSPRTPCCAPHGPLPLAARLGGLQQRQHLAGAGQP